MLGDYGRRGLDVAIDLGSANLRVGQPGTGLVAEFPSVVAVERRGASRSVVAIGEEARRMIGRTPEHISAIQPVRAAEVEDYGLVQELLEHGLRAVGGGRVPSRCRLVIAIGRDTPEVSRRAIQDAARAVGAREVVLLAKSIAAAVGAGLAVQDAEASLLVDMGAGTTEVALLSLGGLIHHEVVPGGGDQLDAAIVEWLADAHGIAAGPRSAEVLKVQASKRAGVPERLAITGRDLRTGVPREVYVEPAALLRAVVPCLDDIVAGVQAVVSRSTPELCSDIADHGLVLSGGAALFPDAALVLRERTGLPVVLADAPRRATLLGAVTLLADDAALQRLAFR